jgi:hypothetical protein
MFLMAASAVVVLAADKPNFSGTWTAQMDKSDFGMMPPPQSMSRKIEHAEPEMKITTTQKGERGENTSESKFTTDGKEATVKMRNREAKLKAKWDGEKLIVESKSEFNGAELTQKETWSLSENGKMLTISNDINSPMGATTVKLVFAKD